MHAYLVLHATSRLCGAPPAHLDHSPRRIDMHARPERSVRVGGGRRAARVVGGGAGHRSIRDTPERRGALRPAQRRRRYDRADDTGRGAHRAVPRLLDKAGAAAPPHRVSAPKLRPGGVAPSPDVSSRDVPITISRAGRVVPERMGRRPLRARRRHALRHVDSTREGAPARGGAVARTRERRGDRPRAVGVARWLAAPAAAARAPRPRALPPRASSRYADALRGRRAERRHLPAVAAMGGRRAASARARGVASEGREHPRVRGRMVATAVTAGPGTAADG